MGRNKILSFSDGGKYAAEHIKKVRTMYRTGKINLSEAAALMDSERIHYGKFKRFYDVHRFSMIIKNLLY
ncbi:hypothetical protein [Lacrimispora sp.]|uniref:hypothetical protein n=1 Tax=Lacrimispora sp. TaxID=2719234 RepID=UPI00289A5B08|nr:hypothetical protein [Lacrimispora sp.]